MKQLSIAFLFAGLIAGMNASATTTICMTDKETVLTLNWDNKSFPAKYKSLTVQAKDSALSDRTSSVKSFGTSAGSPRFLIMNFPTQGEETLAILSGFDEGYSIGKIGFSSKKDFKFKSCKTSQDEAPANGAVGGF